MAQPMVSAAEAARHLGVSSQMLTRYAKAWESATGQSLKAGDTPTAPRLFAPDVLASLKLARQLVAQGKADVSEAVQSALAERSTIDVLAVVPAELRVGELVQVVASQRELLVKLETQGQELVRYLEEAQKRDQERAEHIGRLEAYVVELVAQLKAQGEQKQERLDDLAAQLAEIRDLDKGPLAPVLAEITAARQSMSPERMAVAIHAALPAPAPQPLRERQPEQRGWLSTWLARLGL